MTETSIDETLVTELQAPLAQRLDALRTRIADAAAGDAVQLLPVSKAHPVEAVIAAQRVGLTEFGENYAQELAGKAATMSANDSEDASWHFIGQLQTNKVRTIAHVVTVWQSVDRAKVGTEIAKRVPGATVFAQVNLSEDPGKAGCNFDDLPALIEHLLGLGLMVDGLMGVGTAADDQATAAGFGRLRSAVDEWQLRHCSMGMTGDLELAIAEGSTMVRVGTALFGSRS